MGKFRGARLPPTSRLWSGVIVILIAAGVMFRGVNLDQRTYWVDEVATSIRVAGYTRTEVTQQLATGAVHPAAELLHYQQLTSDRPWAETVQALMQSPEHAPLYFLLARGWVQLLGNSVTAIRSLSVLLSVVALPCMAWFCWQLFQARAIAQLSLGLFAISPFFVAYAQEARPYSLWSVTLLLLGGSLVRALRFQTSMAWSLYAVSLAIALYTSLLTGLVLIGLSGYMILLGWRSNTRALLWQNFGWATGSALVAFAPWLVVLAHHWAALQDNTAWMRNPLPIWIMLAVALYSIAVLFFDVPISVDASLSTVAQGGIALSILVLVVYAVYKMLTQAPKIGLLLLAFSVSTPAGLIALDLIRGGQAAATPRYWIPCQLGVIVIVAYGLGDRLLPADPLGDHQASQWHQDAPLRDLSSEYRAESGAEQQWHSRSRLPSLGQIQFVTGLLIAISLLSCLLNLNRTPAYQKARNQANEAIAAQVNRATSPLLISEADHTMDMLSLSRSLTPETSIRILPMTGWDGRYYPSLSQFVLQPSETLQQQLEGDRALLLELIYQPQLLTASDVHLSLWRIVPRD